MIMIGAEVFIAHVQEQAARDGREQEKSSSQAPSSTWSTHWCSTNATTNQPHVLWHTTTRPKARGNFHDNSLVPRIDPPCMDTTKGDVLCLTRGAWKTHATLWPPLAGREPPWATTMTTDNPIMSGTPPGGRPQEAFIIALCCCSRIAWKQCDHVQ